MPLVVPSIGNARLIEVDYTFVLDVSIPGAIDLAIRVPIVAGTIPFRCVLPFVELSLPPGLLFSEHVANTGVVF